jgi:transposase
MDYPHVLRHLPPEELCACIGQMGTTIERLEADLKATQDELAEAQAQLAAVRKTSLNSSLPPSTDYPTKLTKSSTTHRKARRRRSGRSRTRQEPDIVLDCEPVCCEQCGSDLRDAARDLIGSHQVVEIPPVRAVVVELRRYRRYCICGHCQDDHYPAGYDAPHQAFGPRLHALVSYFNGTHHIAHNRLKQLLRDVFGAPISAGAIVNSLQRTAQLMEAEVQAILKTLLQRDVVGSDETSLRVAEGTGWLWVLQTPWESFFTAAETRSAQVLEDLLGDTTIPVWCCDLASAQLKAKAERFAVCNAHQLRDLQYAVDMGDTLFAAPMQDLLREGLHLSRRQADMPAAAFQAEVDLITTKARDLIEVNTSHKDAKRLQKRFRKHFDKIWCFLDDPAIPFDNNASERALRPAVIHRKVIGRFRSWTGAIAYARYRTLEDTARKRGQNILTTLYRILGHPLDLAPVFTV